MVNIMIINIKPDTVRKNATIRMFTDILEQLDKTSKQCNVTKSVFVEGMLKEIFTHGMEDLLVGTGEVTVYLSNKITQKHADSILKATFPDLTNTKYVESDHDVTSISVSLNGNVFQHDDPDCVFHDTLVKMVALIDG